MAKLKPPAEGIMLTHFIVSDDVERSRRFYTDVLGGTLERSGEPTNVALANSWIVINRGGGPTDDRPAVTLETPPDPDRVSSFLNIRVKDIEAVYTEWSARGAQFLTPPKQHRSLRDRRRQTCRVASGSPREGYALSHVVRAVGVCPAAVPGAACDAVRTQCLVGSY